MTRTIETQGLPHSIAPVVGSNTQSTTSEVRTDLGPLHLDQQLVPFGRWVGKSVWVPPKDNSAEFAKSLLNQFGPFSSRERCWKTLERKHRSRFTQVREIELPRRSLRLPRGRLFVTVTEQEHFDEIPDPIPSCVKTRLDEFMDGPGKKRGVKVYYLKPLCVEVGTQLVFTTQDELKQAISQIQAEVFSAYRRMYPVHLAKQVGAAVVNTGLAIPRALIKSSIARKRREIETYHGKLEFERRKRAMRATQTYQACRTDGCTFEEILALTDPLQREDVIDHYVSEKNLSQIDRKMFLIASAATLPWFAALSMSIYNLAAVSAVTSIAVCDPAFVAQIPGSNGVVLKIGHFDEIDGVMHVEI